MEIVLFKTWKVRDHGQYDKKDGYDGKYSIKAQACRMICQFPIEKFFDKKAKMTIQAAFGKLSFKWKRIHLIIVSNLSANTNFMDNS